MTQPHTVSGGNMGTRKILGAMTVEGLIAIVEGIEMTKEASEKSGKSFEYEWDFAFADWKEEKEKVAVVRELIGEKKVWASHVEDWDSFSSSWMQTKDALGLKTTTLGRFRTKHETLAYAYSDDVGEMLKETHPNMAE